MRAGNGMSMQVEFTINCDGTSINVEASPVDDDELIEVVGRIVRLSATQLGMSARIALDRIMTVAAFPLGDK